MRPQRRLAGEIEAALRCCGERVRRASASVTAVTASRGRAVRSRISWRGTPSVSGKIVRRLSWRSTRSPSAASSAARSSAPRQPHRQRDRVGRARAFQAVEEPQPALRKGQRDLGRARHRTQGRPRRFPIIAETLDQRLDGRGLEQAADGELDIERGADAADQPRRQQRVAAEREEVVVDADPREPQHLGKQRAQRSPPAACAAPRTRRRSEVRRRQRLAVELAVGRERKLVQHHERRRHHVVRQARSKMRAQCRSIGERVRRLPPPHRPPAACCRADPRARCTAACATSACRSSAASISPGSMRKPRSFTCVSARPRKSRTPSARQRARSPVRYIRLPAGPNGSATNRSAVSPARPR